MNLGKKWQIAGAVSTELRFQGYLDSNPMGLSRIKENPERIMRQMKSANTMSGLVSALFISTLGISSIAAAYINLGSGPFHLRMALSISMFLGLTFILMFFMNLMATTGFFGASAMRLLTILPFSRSDLENIILLAFGRVFIAPAVIINVVFPLICFVLLGPLIGLVALAGCLMTTSLSIGALVKVSKWFYVKSHSSTNSKASTIIRIAAGLGIVVGMFAAYSMTGFIPTIVQLLVQLSSSFGEIAVSMLAVVFPFSLGILAAALIPETSFSSVTVAVAAISSMIYAALAYITYLRSGKALRSVALGGVTTSGAEIRRDISVDILSPISAIIRKDMKLATRNLGSIMIIVMPLLMVFSVYPIVAFTSEGFLRSSSALLGTGYITTFTGISLIGLLSLDSQGASLHEGLPIDSRMILSAKVRVFAVQYALAMSVLVIWFALASPITLLLVLLPIIQFPTAYAIGYLVAATIYHIRGGGRVTAVNIIGDQAIVLLSMALTAAIAGAPLGAYALILLATRGNHLMALGMQLAVVLLEFLFARQITPRLLKG
ncbi:MAG: hypothetical protein C4K49_11010 [Candidatus Thorarchaeota archaeon]|nr:MAG: hypothetical protein C4K49_11010 [Candidatus Thorarchaeota archaeon]